LFARGVALAQARLNDEDLEALSGEYVNSHDLGGFTIAIRNNPTGFCRTQLAAAGPCLAPQSEFLGIKLLQQWFACTVFDLFRN
jgi:hypothetical protein